MQISWRSQISGMPRVRISRCFLLIETATCESFQQEHDMQIHIQMHQSINLMLSSSN